VRGAASRTRRAGSAGALGINPSDAHFIDNALQELLAEAVH
jgi:hypothetical protein